MSQYLTHCSGPDTFGNVMVSTQKEESAIVAQACLCSGQNATRIFNSVLRVVTAVKSFEAIELSCLKQQEEQEFYPNSRR